MRANCKHEYLVSYCIHCGEASKEEEKLRKMLQDAVQVLSFDTQHCNLVKMMRRVLKGKSPIPPSQLSENEITELRKIIENEKERI